MGADCVAAWLGALLISTLSFVPAHMAPTRQTRELAGRVARLSLPAPLLVALWTTITTFGLTPPPGGVFLWVLYPPLVLSMVLGAWGIGLVVCAAMWRSLGWRVPYIAALAMGVLGVTLVLVTG